MPKTIEHEPQTVSVTAMRARLDAVDARIQELRAREAELAEKYDEVGRERTGPWLVERLDHFKEVFAKWSTDDALAWGRYCHRLLGELVSIEDGADAAASHFDAIVAEGREAFQSAASDELATWRRAIDELRVQADLASMEARDRWANVMHRTETQRQAASDALEEVSRASVEAWRAVADVARISLRDLKRVVTSAREGGDDHVR